MCFFHLVLLVFFFSVWKGRASEGQAERKMAGLEDMEQSHGESSTTQRLRWNPDLHQRFEEAVNQLGGAESA